MSLSQLSQGENITGPAKTDRQPFPLICVPKDNSESPINLTVMSFDMTETHAGTEEHANSINVKPWLSAFQLLWVGESDIVIMAVSL